MTMKVGTSVPTDSASSDGDPRSPRPGTEGTGNTEGYVGVEQIEGLRVLTLTRPGRHNGMDTQMLVGLADEMRRAAWDRDVRAVLITGAEGTFSAGGDPSEMAGEDPLGTADLWTQISADVASRIFHAEKPVVAAVEGVAIGAGFALAIACDVVLASETARFGPVFVRRGILPDHAALFFLPRIVGLLAAKDLMFSGRVLDATEAESLRLCTRVLPAEGFAEAALEEARDLAAGPTRAMAAAKLVMNKGLETDMWTVQAFERLVQPGLFSSEDFQEGFAAFRERRDPEFRGR
ncbi:MAG: enoyl-CoA hydratase/isomerase family protein [Microthrixaceae bacterium]